VLVDGVNLKSMAMLRPKLIVLDVDPMVRYMDSIPGADVDAFVELDLRVGWRVSHTLDLSILATKPSLRAQNGIP
jgi:hypothetical protein